MFLFGQMSCSAGGARVGAGMVIRRLKLRRWGQIDHPDGRQAVFESKPPEPLAMPLARKQPADINFSTSGHPHCGQAGRSSSVFNVRCSKQ
jgi:hypothetical protein